MPSIVMFHAEVSIHAVKVMFRPDTGYVTNSNNWQ